MINDIIADKLRTIAVLLDLEDNTWESRAYNAARDTINDLTEPVDDIHGREGRSGLLALPDIGDTIADNIESYLEHGRIPKLHDLKDQYPDDIDDIISIRGVGPATTRRLLDELNITGVDDLRRAAENNGIQRLDGLGEATEQKILDGIKALDNNQRQRYLRSTASMIINDVTSYLDGISATQRIKPTGSYRRHQETVGDIDLLVETNDPQAVTEHLKDYEHLDAIEEAGDKKTRFTVENHGVAVDTRHCEPDEWGSHLQYFTGSKQHNIALRDHADQHGKTLAEHGVKDREGNTTYTDETTLYDDLGLQYIPPELREANNEIQRAKTHDIPQLVTADDIRGDLHTHTEWSDGANTIDEMRDAAAKHGHDYIAITDHSVTSRFAGGLTGPELQEHNEAVNDASTDNITVLKGTEANILADGSIDYDDDLLRNLDIVIASVHSQLDLDKETQTKRIITAIQNPHVTCIGHLTGRLINRRPPMSIDYEAVFKAAADHNVALEINSNPNRLDVNAEHAHKAKQHGCTFLINTDSHNAESLSLIDHGVGQARRAGLTPDDVLNAKPLSEWQNQ